MDRYKDELIYLLRILMYMVKKKDPNGVELYFLSTQKGSTFKETKRMCDAVKKHKFVAPTSLEIRLGEYFHPYSEKIQKLGMSEQFRKRIVYVMTDGVLESGADTDGHEAIKGIVNAIARAGMLKHQVGVQFISFGNDFRGLTRLRRLDRLKREYGLKL